MNIIVFGAGAIGSYFGGLLSKQNNVVLIGRSPHVSEINKNGLQIKGETKLKRKIKAIESINQISHPPDLLLLTVKAFDTEHAITEAIRIIGPNTIVLSFQNGLNNIEKIQKKINKKQIIAGITTHGVQLVKPGIIYHKGIGSTVIGEPFNEQTKRIQRIMACFNDAGIQVEISFNIIEDIWKKAIVNASINPLTAIFQCQNGYLAKNPILTALVKKICEESTSIAQQKELIFTKEEMIQRTMKVINQTKRNYSSMLQSVQQGKQTEIDEINGTLVKIGKNYKCDVTLNKLLTNIIKSV